jgi:RHS repeat-associated protein
MDKQHRFVMIDTETQSRVVSGVTLGRTNPEQTVRYQLHNHLGSAAMELDDSAQVISYEEYHPYGTTAFQGRNSGIKAAAKRYRYIGMERDEESGLEYHSARYYLPWLGRWIVCDRAGLRDGPNLFAYVNDNPINNLDLNGKWKVSWTDVAIGAGVSLLVVGAVVVTAGLAAPAAATMLAAVGVSEATVAALGTTAVVAGTAAGVVGTGNTAAEVLTGTTATGRTLSDAERSRRLGALPVEALATALGVRALTGGGGGSGSLPFPGQSGAAALNLAPATVAVSSPSAAAGLSSAAPAVMMSMMRGDGTSSSSSEAEPTSSSSSEPVSENPAQEPMSSESPASEGTYRSQGGHHVHQSASYSPGGPSETGNPNHADAVTVALEGHSTDILSQHGRATAVQRLLNRAARGRFSGEAQVGPVRIEVSGDGTLPPTPNQSFEDVKAFYSMSAAEAPGFQSGEDVLGLVCRSAAQLPTPPVRVPSR